MPVDSGRGSRRGDARIQSEVTDRVDRSDPSRAATGIEGLDDILVGGFPRRRLYLIEGTPGTGKTTLALQFLLEGLRHGERGMYITLSESEEELRAAAASHGWSLDGLFISELIASEKELKAESQYTLFHPSEVELGETTQSVFEEVRRVRPDRVVFDSLSEVRLLARDALRYRRQIMALKQFFTSRGCTTLFLSNRVEEEGDLRLRTLAHGVVALEELSPQYGDERRRLRVSKLRGVDFRGGYHDFKIVTGGLAVFPRLVAAEHHRHFEARKDMISDGGSGLDELLGGGLDRGTSTLIVGTFGTGKSALSAGYAHAAAGRGEHSVIYSFDEPLSALLHRSAGLGMDIREQIASGQISAREVDPAALTPGEFAHMVRRAVECDGARLIVIDGLNGYLHAMPEERFLTAHLHELLHYLNQQGVTSLMTVGQRGILLGGRIQTPIDVSYLADTIIMLYYYEQEGEMRRAISVAKKRTGDHSRSICELLMEPGGMRVGEALSDLRGVLGGTPIVKRSQGVGDGHAGGS